jgi:hypothetical protein
MTTSGPPGAEDLRPLLRRGLPASADVIPDVLLNLPGVRARATTADRESLATSFNTLMDNLLHHRLDPATASAARMLFGTTSATAGKNLTTRRAGAALSLSRDPDHFRKNLEPRILTELAAALVADSDRMRTTRAIAPPLLPAIQPPPEMPQDMWAWEAAEHQEHLARLWSGVYALRAELLACHRLASFDPFGQELVAAAGAALWRYGQLHVAVRAYRRAYGARLLHGDAAPDSLIGLAGWSPPLTPDEVDVVCHHGPDTDDRHAFLTRLTATSQGSTVHGRWFTLLSVHPHITIEAGSAA